MCDVPPGPTSETGCSRGWAGRRRPPTSGAVPSSSQCHVSSPPARGVDHCQALHPEVEMGYLAPGRYTRWVGDSLGSSQMSE